MNLLGIISAIGKRVIGIQPLIFIKQKIDIVQSILVSVVWHGTSKLFCRPDRYRTLPKIILDLPKYLFFVAPSDEKFNKNSMIVSVFCSGHQDSLSRKGVCPPPPLGRGGNTRLRLMGRGEPMRTTVKKAWHSVYCLYHNFNINIMDRICAICTEGTHAGTFKISPYGIGNKTIHTVRVHVVLKNKSHSWNYCTLLIWKQRNGTPGKYVWFVLMTWGICCTQDIIPYTSRDFQIIFRIGCDE